MNPYLENPDIWPGVHNRLIALIGAQLNSILPIQYFADIEHRLIVEYQDENRTITPDISVLHTPPRPGTAASSTGTAVLERAQNPHILSLPRRTQMEETEEIFLAIRETKGRRRVITIIEILSPSNKTAGNSRLIYQQKQWEAVNSEVNLIEIDLLRAGEHAVVPPKESIRAEYGDWDYLVSLSRYGHRDRVEIWLTSLRDSLPMVKVPLKEGDEDVAFDLQNAIDTAYIDGGYARILDYNETPPLPLFSSEDMAWLQEKLQTYVVTHSLKNHLKD